MLESIEVFALALCYLVIGLLWAMETDWNEYTAENSPLFTKIEIDYIPFFLKIAAWPLVGAFWAILAGVVLVLIIIKPSNIK